MFKRFTVFLLLLLILSALGNVYADSTGIQILQNGKNVPFQPTEGRVIVDGSGRTLVPVRKISELLGAQVSWSVGTQTVTVVKNGTTLNIRIGEKQLTVGNNIQPMDTSAQLIENRTYLPLRAIAENLGYDVVWDASARTIAFKEKGNAPQIMQLANPVSGDPVATIKTNLGDIRVKLLEKQAPKAVENFMGLARKGYYNHLTFHRIIPNFMIQGGDPNGNGTGGVSLWGKPFADEFSPDAHNFRGALSMANSGANTNGSQFFIVQLPTAAFTDKLMAYMKESGYSQAIMDTYARIGGTPWLDGKHTVFGQVYSGMDIVDKITAVKCDVQDKPLETVEIQNITIDIIQ